MKKSSHRYEFSTFILYLNLLPKSSQILCPNKFISLLNVSLKKTFLKSLYEMEFPIAFFPKHLQNFCVLLVPALKNKLWNQLLNFPLNYLSFASVNLASRMLKNARFLTIFCVTFLYNFFLFNKSGLVLKDAPRYMNFLYYIKWRNKIRAD